MWLIEQYHFVDLEGPFDGHFIYYTKFLSALYRIHSSAVVQHLTIASDTQSVRHISFYHRQRARSAYLGISIIHRSIGGGVGFAPQRRHNDDEISPISFRSVQTWGMELQTYNFYLILEYKRHVHERVPCAFLRNFQVLWAALSSMTDPCFKFNAIRARVQKLGV